MAETLPRQTIKGAAISLVDAEVLNVDAPNGGESQERGDAAETMTLLDLGIMMLLRVHSRWSEGNARLLGWLKAQVFMGHDWV